MENETENIYSEIELTDAGYKKVWEITVRGCRYIVCRGYAPDSGVAIIHEANCPNHK